MIKKSHGSINFRERFAGEVFYNRCKSHSMSRYSSWTGKKNHVLSLSGKRSFCRSETDFVKTISVSLVTTYLAPTNGGIL